MALTRAQLLQGAEQFHQNGLSAGAQVWFPSLAHYNELRVELGAEPLGRDDVPDNIHFADEVGP